MSKGTLLIVVMMLAGGCDRPDAEAARAEPPPAAALAPVNEATTLDDALGLLQAELQVAIRDQLEGDAIPSLLRAEALTDRLLETNLPFTWIDGERYLVDARIRQIQAKADRLIASIQSGIARDTVLMEVEALNAEVMHLRQALAAGGSAAPPPLDSLLKGDTLPQA